MKMKITDKMKEILSAWTFEWYIYKMPQVDRKDYLEVNKILESLWGKWKTRVWHIFNWEQKELEKALQEVLELWETQTLDEIRKKFQFFETPKNVAELLVELADIRPDDTICEPSAWRWAIAELFPSENEVTLIELNEDNHLHLFISFAFEWITSIKKDFLEYDTQKFDKIIMNPPFSKNQDVKHILHAYSLLEEWWRIVAVASSMIAHKDTKYHKELMALNPEFQEMEEWSFKESWTMVNTCIVILNK